MSTPSEIVADTARLRENSKWEFTLADALEEVKWLRKTPDGIISPDLAKRTILTLGAEIERRDNAAKP